MKNNVSLIYNVFLVLGDFFALVAAFVGAYVLRVTIDARPLIEAVPARSYLGVFLALLPFWIIIFAMLGLYDNNIYEKRFAEIGRLLMGSFIGLLFVIGYNFFSAKPILPARLVPIYGFILAFLFLVIFRNLARFIRTMLFKYNFGITNLLVVGENNVTEELVKTLHDSKLSGYHIVGVVGGDDNTLNLAYPVHVYNSFASACETVGARNIHSVVQTELYPQNSKNNEVLEYAQANHIAYRFIPGNTELFVGNIDVELFRSSIPVIAVHQTALLGWGRIVKRLFDLLVGTVLLIIALPFTVIIATFEILFGHGSIFFRQTRLTRFNHEFRVFKFRTQYQKYDGTTPEQAFKMIGSPELAEKYRENGDFLPKDPRVTPLGRLLRKTSLDELPQLFNVIKGDISLVGPRALIPQELSVYAKRHAILSVKSGLTGLAQVSGRKNISFDERRQLDMYYVQNWSFWFDLVILAKTVRVIFKGS